MIPLERFSLGVGDRFGRQARAQLRAIKALEARGVRVAPVWNKSFREHSLIGTQPTDTRRAADAAVAAEQWKGGYFVDADHISLKNVDAFIPACDFFTLDVADFIGQPVAADEARAFARRHAGLAGSLAIDGIGRPLALDAAALEAIASRYLAAIRAAGSLYRHIAARRTAPFVTEVSMDETAAPQTPAELLVILAGLADENLPLQTIAPKFTGAFHKGIDYVGDPAVFAREFDEDLCVLRHAVARFGLPATLKLSVHSGSDKFSLYPPMAAALRRRESGVHLKTAGTTWLEEVIGLAAAGGEGLAMAKTIYRTARPRFETLRVPYASVVSIDPDRLPAPAEVEGWSSEAFVGALEHNPSHPRFNRDFRQFIHISFRVAAEMGARFTDALAAHAETIGAHVTRNLLDRHLKPLFLEP
jgi:hypothetical protein